MLKNYRLGRVLINSFYQTSKSIIKINNKGIFGKQYIRCLSYVQRYTFVNVPINSKYYHKILPQSVNTSLILCNKQADFREKMVLLEHVTDLIDKDPRLFTANAKQMITTQLKKWENSSKGRMQKIVTIAWIIKKLKLQKKLSKLYKQILMRVYNDQWYVTMEQSIKALQTFNNLSISQYSQQFIQQIFQKIQRNLGLTVIEVNMKYYRRIFVSLVEAHRYDSKLWDKFEKDILRSLGMNYDAKTIFDIINCYAISKNGSNVFYEIVQQIMYKGHIYNQSYMFTKNSIGIQHSGEYLALLTETYALVQNHTKIPLDPVFLDYIYKNLLDPKTKFENLSILTKLLKNMHHIDFIDQEIDTVVVNIMKNKQIQSFVSLEQIYELYSQMEKRYGKVPRQIHQQVVNILLKEIKRKILPLSWSVEGVNFLLRHSNKQQHKQVLIFALEQYLDSRFKYLHPRDQNDVRNVLESAQLISENNNGRLLVPEIKN